MSQQSTPVMKMTHSLLGCIKKSIASRLGRGILPLYSVVVSHIQSAWLPSTRDGKAHKDDYGMGASVIRGEAERAGTVQPG